MRHLILCLTLLAFMFLPGCKEETPKAPLSKDANTARLAAEDDLKPVQLFDEAINPKVVELPSEAIPYWRDNAQGRKSTLVLFSIHPLMDPIKPELKADTDKLMQSGTTVSFKQHGSLYRSEPVILPTQSVSAAIDAGLFTEIVWVFPSSATPEEMQLELFRRQVTEAGFLTEEEGAKLTLNGGTYTGSVRGLPFRAVHPKALPSIDGPIVLHVDLGYFKGLYQGEVKTRLYDLLLNTALAMNETGWKPQLVTLSYSTMEGTFSPDVRFLISNFAELLRNPKLMDGTMPESWALRSEALYSVNFFLEGKVQEYYEQAAQKFPEEAASQYDLYKHMFFEQRKVDEALAVLDKAVALDAGYVAAYLQLAQMANDDGNLPAAVELLSKAAPLIPENPFVDLYRAQFMLQMGQDDVAKPLIEQLQTRSWSSVYHAEVPQLLNQMLSVAKGEPQSNAAPQTPAKEAPVNDPSRKRVLK